VETAHAEEAGGRLGQSRNWEHSLGGSLIQSQQQLVSGATCPVSHLRTPALFHITQTHGCGSWVWMPEGTA